MDGRELPGFYFDREKKKYFRITPASRAPPEGYKYTKENIKKERKQMQADNVGRKQAKRRKTETLTSAYRKDFLAQAYIDREIGYARRSHYQQKVWPGACVVGWEPERVLPTADVRAFEYSPSTDNLYTVAGDFCVKRYKLGPGGTAPNPSRNEPSVGWGYMRDRTMSEAEWHHRERFRPERLAQLTSPISSMHFLPTSGALAATTFGSDRSPVVYFTDPEVDGPYIGVQFTPPSCSTIWTSAPRPVFSTSNSDPGSSVPAATEERLAVGASPNFLYYWRCPTGDWNFAQPLRDAGYSSDIQALCWLDERTIAFGHRNGKIKLFDTRTHGVRHVLSHSAPVSHIRRTDDFSRIIVGGICNSLVAYDLRAGVPQKVSKKQQKKGGLPFPSSPTLYNFQGYVNEGDSLLGMDVDARLGLVAAAGEDQDLKIWNMYTGELVKKVDGGASFMGPLGQPEKDLRAMRAVRFIQDKDGDRQLWANFKGGVGRMKW